jgi:putative Mn2+ efflux pump MntP
MARFRLPDRPVGFYAARPMNESGISLWAVVGIALGLAMDAVAVSMAAATAGFAGSRRAIFRLAFHFGLFQFLMPVIGWAAGTAVAQVIPAWDHWIAFVLLAGVGAHMLWAAFHPDQTNHRQDPSRGLTLVALSMATSLDALAVGVSLALAGIAVWTPSLLIGLITGLLCLLAILLGNRLRHAVARYAEIAGGLVLVFIGLKILIAHLP